MTNETQNTPENAREWIAAGGHRWERRATRAEAVEALSEALGAARADRTLIRVVEVPAGAYVDQMGTVRFEAPEGWEDWTPEQREAYGPGEAVEVEAVGPRFIIEHRPTLGGDWYEIEAAYNREDATEALDWYREDAARVGGPDTYRIREIPRPH